MLREREMVPVYSSDFFSCGDFRSFAMPRIYQSKRNILSNRCLYSPQISAEMAIQSTEN